MNSGNGNGKMPFRERLARFMLGRNGVDNLYNFLTVICFILIIVNLFANSYIISALVLAVIIYSMYRVFSKDLYRRKRENAFYLRQKNAVIAFFRLCRDRWRDRKTYVYRRCPKCKNVLRLPRRSGDHTVRCPACEHRFDVKIR